jgi:hypothetical protein
MNRYKEKYAGGTSGQSTPGGKQQQVTSSGKGQAGGARQGTGPTKRPGILDRIKRLFGGGKDRD